MIDLEHTKQSTEAQQELPSESDMYQAAEQSLLQFKEGYRRLFEEAPTAIGILNQKLNILLGNPCMEQITGYRLEELRTLRIEMLFTNPASYQKLLWTLSESGEVREWEVQLTRKDGIPCIVLLNIEKAELGGQTVFFTYMRDITERKQIEKSLLENKGLFRLIAESIDDVFRISDGEKIVYVSPAFERVFGYPRPNVSQTLEFIHDTIHPDDREHVTVAQATMKEGKPFDLEYRITRPDGSIRHIWDRGFPVPDENDMINRYVCIARDVTEWKIAEEAFKEFTDYLNQIINCIADPVFVKDRQLRFTLVNDAMCAFSGQSRDKMLGKTVRKLLPKEQADFIERQEELVFESGQESIVEEEVNPRQNEKRIVMAKKALLRNKLGEKQIVGVIRDITEYKSLEAQFLQAQKMEAVGVLAGGVAHDFNNLIMVINGYSDFLLNDLDQDDPRRKEVEQIKDAGQRAASLTSQLLAFSRKQILSPQILDLNTSIEDMGIMLRRLIGEDIEIVIIAAKGLGMISADPGQIQQIIMNLVSNAREAMPKGGKITIETADVDLDENYSRKHAAVTPGPYVMLAISDNGMGMDEETQARIFEPFFSTKGPGKGTGLGLSTVYGIVQQSGGTIWLYSELGQGTTFKIYFPRVEAKADKSTEISKIDRRPKRTKTVLVVEDEFAVRGLTVRILKKQGYKVLEASNGKDALSVVREYADKIHLVITDVVMPGMSGKDLITQIEALRPGIKSLYTSGYTSNAIVHHHILDSKVDFLQKPFNADALLCKVGELIDSSKISEA
jgi:two-component system cell cycle sensor histidine kinase/response regulator CckA